MTELTDWDRDVDDVAKPTTLRRLRRHLLSARAAKRRQERWIRVYHAPIRTHYCRAIRATTRTPYEPRATNPSTTQEDNA